MPIVAINLGGWGRDHNVSLHAANEWETFYRDTCKQKHSTMHKIIDKKMKSRARKLLFFKLSLNFIFHIAYDFSCIPPLWTVSEAVFSEHILKRIVLKYIPTDLRTYLFGKYGT